MKISISNLVWGGVPITEVAPKLKDIGMDGIEIAPTALWKNFGALNEKEIREFRAYLNDLGLSVSGLQSLLFGHPELQLFDRNTWPKLQNHLTRMIDVAGILGTKVVVFGSPKNRLKGLLTMKEADTLAVEFISKLIPILDHNDVVLTLEPNAPEYGADYLTSYSHVVELSKLIHSDRVSPQIDTGCLWMVEEDPAQAFESFVPQHVHLSTPNLGRVPGKFNFQELFNLVNIYNYEGWLTIESLNMNEQEALESAKWLSLELRKMNDKKI